MVVLAYIVVYSVRTTTYAHDFFQASVFTGFATTMLLVALYLSGGYRRIWARTSGHEVTVIVKATAGATLVVAGIDYFLRPRPVPLSVVLVGNLIAMVGFVAVRYRSRLISGLSWRWKAVWRSEFPDQEERVLIVGAGEAGQITAWRLKHRYLDGHNGYEVIGFVDDDLDKQGMYVEGAPVLGMRMDIPELVVARRIDLIVVAVHNISGEAFRDILTYCEQTPARIKIVPDIFAVINGKAGAALLRDVRAEDLLGRQQVGRHEGVDLSPITGKRVLVTGAAGSIGAELCRQLLAFRPQELVLLDNNESGLHDLLTELKNDHGAAALVPVLADITNVRAMQRVMSRHQPEVIFHSAAFKHVPMLEHYPEEAVRVNIGGTRVVGSLACEFKVERFVLISTDKAVDPSSVMGATKRVCELLMHALASRCDHPTLFTSVRFGNVLGSRGSVVPTFNRQIESGGPVTVTDRDMTRYFMTIPEAVNLVLHAACLTRGDDLFMLRMGEVVRIVDLAERMIRLRGLRPYDDIPIVFTGMRPGEKLHEQLHTEAETTVPTTHPDIVQLVASHNGIRPTMFNEEIEALLGAEFEAEGAPLDRLRAIIHTAEGEFHAQQEA